MRLSYRFIIFMVRVYMRIFYNYKVVNRDYLKTIDGCLIAANHISANDPPFIGSIMPMEINYLAKIELFRKKIAAAFLLYVNAIPVKRGRIDIRAIKTVEEKLAKGQSVLIFPEGTRKSAKTKPGIGKIALETKKNILPILIKNTDDLKGCLFRKKRVEIIIGKIINTEPFQKETLEKQDYRDLAEYVMTVIRDLDNDHTNS